MKFKPKNTHTKFWTNKDVSIEKLDKEIQQGLGVKRWEDTPDKKGYSGISITYDEKWKENKKKAKNIIVVHWTEDGIKGFNINFPTNDKKKVQSAIDAHVPENIPG